jgi:hypothetical protein
VWDVNTIDFVRPTTAMGCVLTSFSIHILLGVALEFFLAITDIIQTEVLYCQF